MALRNSRCVWAVALLGALSLGGCTGTIGDSGSSQAGNSSNGHTPGSPNAGVGPGGAYTCTQDHVPAARVWRLSTPQYVASLASMTDVGALTLSTVPPDGDNGGFDTNAVAAFVTDQLAQVYHDNAKAVATAIVQQLTKAGACATKSGAGASCVQSFINEYGTKAFRRPLAAEETTRFSSFYTKQAAAYDAPTASTMALEALLQSPSFLYRTELGSGAGGSGTKIALSQYELASELSYFLTDSPPSASLLQIAADQKLGDKAAVESQARALLGTPGARAKLQDFFYQLLQLKNLVNGTVAKDPAVFPTFTPTLRDSMIKETLTFVDKEVWEAKTGLVGLFSAPYSYVDAAMAGHYGLSTSGLGVDFQKTMLDPAKAGGLLSQASVMSTLAKKDTTWPAHRGLLIRKGLLCTELPPPPAGAQNMPEKLLSPDPMATKKQDFDYFKQHQPSCATCHVQFFPLGLAFERYDAIGRWRDTENGRPIDSSGTLLAAGTATGDFENDADLVSKVIGSSEGQQCLVQQYMTYAYGRPVGPATDACAIESIAQGFATSHLSLPELLVAMTQDDSFYYRSTGQ